MSIRRMVALQAGLLLVAMLANAASLKKSIEITVLDSETRAMRLNDNNGVPINCEQLTFDAYCRSSAAAPLVNTLLVQIGSEAPFRVQCIMESKFSKCTPLQKGERFEARREKKGVTIYYVDDKGKARRQYYTLVNDGGKAGSPAVAVATPPSAPPAENVTRPASSTPAVIAAPMQSSPVQAPAVTASSVPAVKVKCDFTSTPPGAEISVDWRYVGNTPSEIGLSAGTHIVVISMPGFAEWKRELTVGSDSELNVTAVLQKPQP